jgi:hypothetical protein
VRHCGKTLLPDAAYVLLSYDLNVVRPLCRFPHEWKAACHYAEDA